MTNNTLSNIIQPKISNRYSIIFNADINTEILTLQVISTERPSKNYGVNSIIHVTFEDDMDNKVSKKLNGVLCGDLDSIVIRILNGREDIIEEFTVEDVELLGLTFSPLTHAESTANTITAEFKYHTCNHVLY